MADVWIEKNFAINSAIASTIQTNLIAADQMKAAST
jgi:hypothetical protein